MRTVIPEAKGRVAECAKEAVQQLGKAAIVKSAPFWVRHAGVGHQERSNFVEQLAVLGQEGWF
jgi:hypothetical protein